MGRDMLSLGQDVVGIFEGVETTTTAQLHCKAVDPGGTMIRGTSSESSEAVMPCPHHLVHRSISLGLSTSGYVVNSHKPS